MSKPVTGTGTAVHHAAVPAAELPELYAELVRASRCQMAWVMNPGAYKRIRRVAAANGLGDGDESKWVPAPGDYLPGCPMVVREDGGEPHIEWLTREEIGL